MRQGGTAYLISSVFEGSLGCPEGSHPVGKTVFDGCDLAPASELGSSRLPEQQVLANPEEPGVLLLRGYPSGLERPEYWVFGRFRNENDEAPERKTQGEGISPFTRNGAATGIETEDRMDGNSGFTVIGLAAHAAG